jgi:hypothetical protein
MSAPIKCRAEGTAGSAGAGAEDEDEDEEDEEDAPIITAAAAAAAADDDEAPGAPTAMALGKAKKGVADCGANESAAGAAMIGSDMGATMRTGAAATAATGAAAGVAGTPETDEAGRACTAPFAGPRFCATTVTGR